MSAGRLALFDMDRTLVRADTGMLYVRYQRKRGEVGRLHFARVVSWALQHKLGLLDAHRATEKAYAWLEGRSEESLFEHSGAWFSDGVARHITDAARRAVARHLEQGDLVAIVTGQTPYIASPVARELGIEHVIATRLEVRDGRLTGKVLTPLSYGRGKVDLAESFATARGFSLREAAFYSDSASDLPLLSRVGTPVAVNPDARLRRIATTRAWRIETW